MFSEKKFSLTNEKEAGEPKIIIKRSVDAPSEVKENPFYDPEFWGCANSPDDIYLPDSDEAISFALAAHEIGHLVKEGKINNARLDNFEATRAEEQRAWDKGWEYLQQYVDEYYQGNPEDTPKILQAFERIKTLLMQATDLSKDMYLESGTLDNLTTEEMDGILKEKREKFFSEKGEEFKKIFEEIKEEKIGIKPDWDKFTTVVKKAVQDILKDNKKAE
ncbi:MAG: hypothetical protein V1829_00400 [bacterium]|nr:hypothetical protein [Patescibacteria group bacterium]